MKNAQSFCADVLNQTKTVFHKDGYREDIPLFDRIAFREAWYNACLHNDWVDGTPPAIYVFNDRLEIISTGGLPHNMTKEDFYYKEVTVCQPYQRNFQISEDRIQNLY